MNSFSFYENYFWLLYLVIWTNILFSLILLPKLALHTLSIIFVKFNAAIYK